LVDVGLSRVSLAPFSEKLPGKRASAFPPVADAARDVGLRRSSSFRRKHWPLA
jgi:hypothetical protein